MNIGTDVVKPRE